MNENNFYHFQIVILPLLRRVKIVDKACEVDIGYDVRKGSFLSTVPRDFFPRVER